MDNTEFDEFVRKLNGNVKKCTDEKVIAQMRALENDPVLMKKDQEMEEALMKNPIPEWVLNRTPKPE